MSFFRILVTGTVVGITTFVVINALANRTTAGSVSSSRPFVTATDAPLSFFDAKRCDADAGDRVNCYDRFISAYAGQKTTKELLAELDKASKEDTAILVDCHPLTHAIGRWTFGQTGDVAAAFDRCDLTCHSGCYHGAVERVFFTEAELDAGVRHADEKRMQSVVKTICDEAKFPNHIGLVQCIHGAGHAIMHGLDYDLWESLKTCDYFDDPLEANICYSGVFMENITAAEKDRRLVNPKDPLFPCNLPMDEKYLSNCLFFQPSFLLEFHYAPEDIFKVCRESKLPGECAKGYGRELAGDIRLGFANQVAYTCETHGAGLTDDCTRGTVNSALENSQNGEAAYPYCMALKDDGDRDFCFRWAGWYAATEIGFTPDGVFDDCEKYAGSGQPGCTLAREAALQ